MDDRCVERVCVHAQFCGVCQLRSGGGEAASREAAQRPRRGRRGRTREAATRRCSGRYRSPTFIHIHVVDCSSVRIRSRSGGGARASDAPFAVRIGANRRDVRTPTTHPYSMRVHGAPQMDSLIVRAVMGARVDIHTVAR
jgi:hypothetical protein